MRCHLRPAASLWQGQARFHVQLKSTVRVHMAVEPRRQHPEVFLPHAAPHGRAQHALDHQRVDVDQHDLKEVQAQDGDLLIVEPPRRPRCLEGFDGFVTSTAAPIATGRSDQLSGRELHPLKIRAFSRRTVIGTPKRANSSGQVKCTNYKLLSTNYKAEQAEIRHVQAPDFGWLAGDHGLIRLKLTAL
jgi:hypothetical protein